MQTDEPGTAAPPGADQVQALVAELAGRSDLVWVTVGQRPGRAMWHVWHDGAVTLVTGGIEQPDPGLTPGSSVMLTFRSRENRARQLSVLADVEQVAPGTAAWEGAVAALHPKRLNAPDGEEQPVRWSRESTVWVLRPTLEAPERPGAMSSGPHRAEPVPSTATTLTRTPFHAGSATKKRR